MKRLTLLVGFLVALVFLGAMSAPTVSAQALDNVWLKCKVSAKGHLRRQQQRRLQQGKRIDCCISAFYRDWS
jgi:hypothetical protein